MYICHEDHDNSSEGMPAIFHELHEIGGLGVDAGTMTAADREKYKTIPNNTHEGWLGFCKEVLFVNKFPAFVHDDMVFSQTGYGDGVYEARGCLKESGELVEAIVLFVDNCGVFAEESER
jgi:hypothetical protein